MPLQLPPHDDKGNVLPHDHPEIFSNDVLIRGISGQHIYVDKRGNKRIASIAFQCSTDGTGMSVDIKKSIEEAGDDPATFVMAKPFLCSVQFNAGDLRREGHQVGYMPLSHNPHHGAVWGIHTKGQSRRLLRLAVWFVKDNGIILSEAA
jgi:hypothetical protein